MTTITYEEAKKAKEVLIAYIEEMQNNFYEAKDKFDGTEFSYSEVYPEEAAALIALRNILN